jgi:hypothetical protein
MPIEKKRILLAVMGSGLALFAAVNLFGSFTPAADRNTKLDNQFASAVELPLKQKLPVFTDMMHQQERILAARPSEPYGWARLAHLRHFITGNNQAAFEALRMSDLVSPYEAAQMPERALMWRDFRAVQTGEQRDYQDALWEKAFTMQGAETLALARKAKIVNEVGDALKRRNPVIQEHWQAYDAQQP